MSEEHNVNVDARTELEQLKDKVNELEKVVFDLGCIESEKPIYETLGDNEVLIISKSEGGFLVASNRLGSVELERVKYPEDD